MIDTLFSGSFFVESNFGIKATLKIQPAIATYHVAARLTGESCVSIVFVTDSDTTAQKDFVAGTAADRFSAGAAFLANYVTAFGPPDDGRATKILAALARLATEDFLLIEREAKPMWLYRLETKARS